MPVSVGIDLGTTYSAVAYVDQAGGAPKIIPNLEGKKTTPSVIRSFNGRLIFGSEAEAAYAEGLPDCAVSFKRQMGSNAVCCTLEGKSYTPEDLSALLLRKLKEDAEAVLGDTIRDAVITVPAYFYSPEREATIRSAERAGLKVRKIIDEPSAAAMAYGLGNWRENAVIMVYDLGGGTFDVTLTRMLAGGELHSEVTKGDHKLGGRDWDERLAELLLEKFRAETMMDLCGSEYEPLVRGMAEPTKRKLSSMLSAILSLEINGVKVNVTVTRQEFEERTRDLLERTLELCRGVLKEANFPLARVSDILLVGGSTKMPRVSEILTQEFGKKPIKHVNPDEAVALGAAIQATKSANAYVEPRIGMKDGKVVTLREPLKLGLIQEVKDAYRLQGVGEIFLRETTAHAMGIISINDEKNCYYNEVIIPANHERPIRLAKRFRFPTRRGENEMSIYVLQGDDPDPQHCLIAYKYVVSGIRHIPNGHPDGTIMRIQYSYDDNGVIHVQARQEDDKRDLPIRKETTPRSLEWLKYAPNSAEGKRAGVVAAGGVGNVVHQYKAITFSNVTWTPYDNIAHHEYGRFIEHPYHTKATEKRIEFIGYHVSQMDEGVSYSIGAFDDFEIECDIDTSKIKQHPGGYLYITLGPITAQLNQHGGNMLLNGQSVFQVGSRFQLNMAVHDGGHFSVSVDRHSPATCYIPSGGNIDVIFGFQHDSHYCEERSDAHISNIRMRQKDSSEANGAETEPWDD